VSDAFLSYSRRDRELAIRIRDALVTAGKEPWIDVEGIPPTAAWRDELVAAIDHADAFVFLISPDSAASPECLSELSEAEAMGKRVIGVLARAADPSALPEFLSQRQFVPAQGVFEDNFDASFAALVDAMNTDLEWVRGHTAWGNKAIEWERHRRNRSFLLVGAELQEAERWLAGQAGKDPPPTALQASFILDSRRRTTRRLQSLLGAMSLALLVVIALAVVAVIERGTAITNEHVAESGRLAAESETALATNPQHATYLALRALEIAPTGGAQASLRDALPALQLLGGLAAPAPFYSPTFTPDGRRILTASADGAAEVWDASTGRRVELLSPANATGLEQSTLSPDGKLAVTADDHGVVRIWALANRRLLGTIENPVGAGINGVSVSPDGKVLVTADSDGSVRLWNLATRTAFARFALPRGTSSYAAAISAGGVVAAAGSDGTAELWRQGTRHPFHTLRDPDGDALYAITFSPNGRIVATASFDGVARVWDVATGALVARLPEPGGAPVYGVAFSPDGRRLLTASKDGWARIWDIATGRELNAVEEPAGAPLESGVFNPAGTRIVTASLDGTTRVWSATARRQLVEMTEPASNPITSVSFNTQGTQIVTAGADGTVRIWDAKARSLIGELTAVAALPILTAAFSPDGRAIVYTQGASGTVSGPGSASEVLYEPTPSDGNVDNTIETASFDETGSNVLTASDDGTARIWNLATGRPEKRFGTVGGPALSDAVYGVNGREIVTAAADGYARIWSTVTGALVARLGPLRGLATARFSPDGKDVVMSGTGGAAIFNIARRTQVLAISEPGGAAINSAVFSPDGRSILTASADGSVRRWDTATGKQLVAYLAGAGPVNDGEFSANGRFVVTAGDDGMARIWDAAPREQLSAIVGPDGSEITSAGIDRDARRIVTVGNDGVTRIWDASSLDELRTIRSPSGRLTGAVLNPAGTLVATVEKSWARVFDVATGRELAAVPGSSISSAAFNPAGTVLAVGDSNGIRFVSPEGGSAGLAPISTVLIGAAVQKVAFDSTGTRVVAVLADATARVWKLGATVAIARGVASEPGGSAIATAVFSPNGRELLTASVDGTARLWNAANGTEVGHAITEPLGGILSGAAFSPDGRQIAVASLDGITRIWDLATGRQLTASADGPGVQDVAYSGGGGEIVTADGRATIWSTELAGPLVAIERIARTRLAIALTPAARSARGRIP
jgi:WD40 repeat protein